MSGVLTEVLGEAVVPLLLFTVVPLFTAWVSEYVREVNAINERKRLRRSDRLR